jgi:S-adenosylmethionine:tRNA-ribosyltransferase-isomerase (queuine synthetase)
LSLRVDDFDFDPPRALTAPRRNAARLLLIPAVVAVRNREIADLPASSRADDLLVNNTKVIPARLVVRRMLLDTLCRGIDK